MHALLERSRSARAAVVMVAIAAVLGLAHAAVAGGDLGLKRDTLWPEPQQPPLQLIDVPDVAAAPVRHRHARRIWAASRTRPLRITLARRPHRTHVARIHSRTGVPVRLASLRPVPDAQVVFPRLILLPKPPRPALVTIYQDRTLRNGDAVMMADGVHVFRGPARWPHQPSDFVRLTFAASLDWHLRQTLDVLDRNPPTRWSSLEPSAG